MNFLSKIQFEIPREFRLGKGKVFGMGSLIVSGRFKIASLQTGQI
jgi:hypothetical protein